MNERLLRPGRVQPCAAGVGRTTWNEHLRTRTKHLTNTLEVDDTRDPARPKRIEHSIDAKRNKYNSGGSNPPSIDQIFGTNAMPASVLETPKTAVRFP